MSALAAKTKAKPKSKIGHYGNQPIISNAGFNSRNPAQFPSQRLSAFYSCGPAVGLASPVQAKFTIGQANDPYEREADSVADRVSSGQPAPPISSIPPGGLGSIAQPEIEEEEKPEEMPPMAMLIQRQAPEEEELEESPPMPMLIQRQEVTEEVEEPEETSPMPMLIQRQAAEEELEETRSMPMLVQRQEATEEEEEIEKTSSMPMLIQRQEEGEEPEEITQIPTMVQRQDVEEEEKPDEMTAQTKRVQLQLVEEEEGEEKTPQAKLIQCERVEEEEEPKPQTKLLQTDNCSARSNSQNDFNQNQLQRRVSEDNQPDETELQAQQHSSTSRSGYTSRSRAISKATNNAGTGETLKPSMRTEMESGLGVDLSDVRVHSDGVSHGAANSLKARAFTHGSDIWLGSGQSQDDTRLMAHELTHVVQQTSGAGNVRTIQRKPSDYRHPEDGGGVRNRLQQRFDEDIDEPEAEEDAGSEADAQRRSREIDRSELREKTDEVKDETRPDVDRPAEEKPGVDQSAQQVEKEAETPGEPLVEEEQPEVPAEEGTEEEPISVAEQAATLADEAFAAADSQPEPGPQMAVVPPEPVTPVDSEGASLAGNPETDAQVADLAERAQMLRDGGTQLRTQAAEERGNAEILRGNLEKVSGEIGKAEEGITKSQANSEYRQQLKGQAEEALSASEEKAAMVAEQAPEFTSKADEGKEDTGPMSQEASDLAARNAENTPEDPEAAAKSREQGQKINSTGSDAATMDDAVSQTREKAGSLAEDATRAAEMNTQSQEKITETEEKLTETDARLEQMTGETNEAKTQVGGLRRAPNQVTEQANQLDQRGLALIAASFDLENRLNNVQRSYEQGMRSVPALEPWEEEEGSAGAPASEEFPVQMTPDNGAEEQASPSEEPSFGEAVLEGYLDPNEGRYDEREQVNVAGALPGWLTGVQPESEERREEAREREEQRRENEVNQINELAGGHFEDLDAGDKMGIALRLVGQNFANSISNIKWPGWGGLAKMLLDPRTTLMGVISGLSMMLSGAVNLFSAEQWTRDPLGNLLKSAADIATGLTIILASITALAGLVAAIMGALILITFGAFSPIGLPVISVCTTIITTVGGWTIAVGKVALVLQALSLIKNLIDAATADTAEDLQNQSDQIRADTVAAGMVVMSIVGAKGASAGIKNLRRNAMRRAAVTRSAGKAGGGLRGRAAALGRLEGRRIASGARAVGRGVARGGRALGRGAAAVGRGAARGARAVGRGVARGGRAIGRGAAAVGRGVARGARAVGRGIVGGARGIGRGFRGLRERLRSPATRRRGGSVSIITSERVRGRIWINEGIWGMPKRVVENMRLRLLRQRDIGRVQRSLIESGIPVDRELIRAVKRYNFDNPGIEFIPDNYNAWRRLATGRFTTDDIRYIIHEMAELRELRRIRSRTGFDYMGTSWENMGRKARRRWEADFNRIFDRAHARALEAEYDFVARQVAEMTNRRVRISRTVAAAVDPIRDEGRFFMLVDGVPLKDHFNFARWETRATEIVSIGRSAAERLNISENPILGELVAAVKLSPVR